jgi:hypothetical protein
MTFYRLSQERLISIPGGAKNTFLKSGKDKRLNGFQ